MASSASTGVTAASVGPQNQSISQKFTDFGHFLYNSDEGTVLGRTAKSWGHITIFYIIYYACLSGFFAALCAVFYQTLDWNFPKLSGPDSLLRQNPGMGFRPIPDVSTTLVRFVKGDPTSYSPYTDHMEAYLSYYENENQVTDTGVIVDCDAISGRRPESEWDKACRFDLTQNLGADCVKQQAFGFDDGLPCILVKLNRIFDWMPQMYTNGSVPPEIADMYQNYYVTVKCTGENPSDQDNIGPITYYPAGGFHYKYFPFRNQQGYRTPLVFVRFERPTPGVLIMVECRAYAANIQYDRLEKAGSVHFELLVD
ncbi:probable sodium/potassium-transporting ATPase subunit beta-3 [Ylistrum balloti]|uniref:probable sodium/potassium-transporting ATPase subunit beta-3 n=1 Tax=Ylistrum balloti TaxID=509963 RepID=UPI002905A46B|nr:probable sodium/potassium-transporting ATPase subunit beta-3 [Ylistrum balloti]